jgi:hypothetical protein
MGNSKTTVIYAIYDGNYSTTPIAKIIRFMSAKLVQARPFAAGYILFLYKAVVVELAAGD